MTTSEDPFFQIEHFELARGCRRNLPEANGRSFESAASSLKFDQSRLIRFSSESFPDLEGSQLRVLREICHGARSSEEFFLCDAADQWLRTAAVSNKDLFQSAITSDFTIHSNMLPYEPYWTLPPAVRNGASSNVYFPYSIIERASQEEKSLMIKLHEWKETKEECCLGKYESQERLQIGNVEQPGCLKPIWKIAGSKTIKIITDKTADGKVSRVECRRGFFIRKEFYSGEGFVTEFNAMKKLCHPNIVHVFGISWDGNAQDRECSLYVESMEDDLWSVIFENVRGGNAQDIKCSLYMEHMENDLLSVIFENVRAPDGRPPFSKYDSADILLQVAKAMLHMHENNVIHGDLKSNNILISKFKLSEDRHHYVAKVADCGSARDKNSEPFQPAFGTTNWAAPEVLKCRVPKTRVDISIPESIDVYSFGIVAFEVLTGKKPYGKKLPSEVKEGVMQGVLKPPLSKECRNEEFLNDESLIQLIKHCWESPPERRPSFLKIVEVLVNVKAHQDQPLAEAASGSSGFYPTSSLQANNTFHEEAVQATNGRHPQLSDQANNTSTALHVQVPRRRRNFLKKLLPFSCVSSGNVKD